MSASEFESGNTKQRLLSLMNRVHDLKNRNVKNSTGNIVAFVGLTKSGKSTLINCLMGSPLICLRDPDTGVPIIENDYGSKGPKIGVDGESETVNPENFGCLPGTNMEMWDFPGFEDNKGTDQEVLNAISYQMILRGKKRVRFVVVATYNLIDGDNPVPFFELLHHLIAMSPQIDEGLCIVGSKADNTSIKGLLKKVSAQRFPNADASRREVIQTGQHLIKKVLENGSYLEFKSPEMDYNVSRKRFVLPNVQEIVDCIRRLDGVEMGEVPFIVSHEAKAYISKYYETSCNILKANVNEICRSLIKYMDSKGTAVREGNAAIKLDIHKSGKRVVEGILAKAEDFKSFFHAVKHLGMGASSGFPEYLARFTFVQELRCLENKSDDMDQFFRDIQSCLKNGIAQYNDLIAQSEIIVEREKREADEVARIHNTEVEMFHQKMNKIELDSRELVDRAASAQAGAEEARREARRAAEAERRAAIAREERMERMEERRQEMRDRRAAYEFSRMSSISRLLDARKERTSSPAPSAPAPSVPASSVPAALSPQSSRINFKTNFPSFPRLAEMERRGELIVDPVQNTVKFVGAVHNGRQCSISHHSCSCHRFGGS